MPRLNAHWQPLASAAAVWLAIICLAAASGCDSGVPSASSQLAAPAGTPSACNPASEPGGPYCLIFVGSAYDVHIGQRFKAALVADDGSTVIASNSIAALPAASFTLTLPRSMQAGVPYYVDYYADNQRDGICDAPGFSSDHVWRSHVATDFFHGYIITVTAQAGDFTLSQPHDDVWLNVPMNTCPQLNQTP